jgi:RNA-binding protein
MPLDDKLKRALRGRGHGLKPVVSIGTAGLGPAVLREIDLSLEHHELMKIRIGGADRSARQAMIDRICTACGADLVQSIGHVALIFRERQE